MKKIDWKRDGKPRQAGYGNEEDGKITAIECHPFEEERKKIGKRQRIKKNHFSFELPMFSNSW